MAVMTQAAPSGAVPVVIEFLLDETGSMAEHLHAVIGGFNDYIGDQRKQDGLALLTLTKFDTNGLRTPYVDVDLRMAPDLTLNTFVPGQFTNLHDAILARVADLEDRLRDWTVRPHVLFVCMTDGDDNRSRSTPGHVREKIAEKSSQGWTFVYLGAHERALMAAEAMGFPRSNAKQFKGAESRAAYAALSTATTAYRAATVSAAAPKASDAFFAS